MRRLLAVLTLAAALVPALPPAASARSVMARPMHRPPATTGVRVSLESHDGSALPTVMHHGTTFVAGELGERYAIRIVNDGPDRLEVVVAVDGRDVLSGKHADPARQRGYVVQPFGTVVIDGFRRSLDHVAAFRFTDVADSFAGRLGTPQQAGVIAVSVFRERATQEIARHHGSRAAKPEPPARSRGATSRPSTRPSADPAAPAERSRGWDSGGELGDQLGTQFGETRVSRVVEVAFVRRSQSRADERLHLVYDTERRLLARGVPIDVAIARPWDGGDPSWPSARGDTRFTTPPPR